MFWTLSLASYLVFFFFFQAEDGIRDLTVTGVQTCALPILLAGLLDPGVSGQVDDRPLGGGGADHDVGLDQGPLELLERDGPRSEERRVGKECRSRWGRQQYKE